MKARVHVIWLDVPGAEDPFTAEDAQTVFGAITDAFEGLRVEFDSVSSESGLFEFLDQCSLGNPSAVRETLYWLLLPSNFDGRKEILGEKGKVSTSLLLPRLAVRYSLSWLHFHFFARPLHEARAMLSPTYESKNNGGCDTGKRTDLIYEWHFSFGQLPVDRLKRVAKCFSKGVRQWFDPLGFRGAMLEMLKDGHISRSCTNCSPRPRTVRESRRVFFATVIDDEPIFAMCAAYALYRAGLGSMPVCTESLFGKGNESLLAEILRKCSGGEGSSGGAVVFRDLDLQFPDAKGDIDYEIFNEWPQPLHEIIEDFHGVAMRAISVKSSGFRIETSEGDQKQRRLGIRDGKAYIGLAKPIASLVLSRKAGLHVIPFHDRLVGVTKGRAATETRKGGARTGHSAPRHLQETLRFLSDLSNQLGESKNIDDIISAALLQLVRLEALRGAGPLLVGESIDQLNFLEAKVEILSPYFVEQPELAARLQEVDECMSDLSDLGQPGMKSHLVRQILGRLKVLYQTHGVFGAADRVQQELLARPRFLDQIERYLTRKIDEQIDEPYVALISIGRQARRCVLALSKLMACIFFHPAMCLVAWVGTDLVAFALAPSCQLGDFVYFALTGDLSDNLGRLFRDHIYFVNTVVVVNILFLAVFTASLFRWMTRD